MFGLQDIFFTRSLPDQDDAARSHHTQGGHNEFYTFRMEHRQGGPMSKFRGEERILLFRSDKAGAIAKIIYSSEAPDEPVAPVVESIPLTNQKEDHNQQQQLTALAKIHVLEVKAQYRGRDFGGLLVRTALTSLKSLYCNEEEDVDVSVDGSAKSQRKKIYDVECSLDAEEDITRHGKLVKFYE